MTRPSKWRRLKDLFAYCGIGVAVVALALAFAVHQAKTNGSPDLPLKWLGFVGMSAIVFGYAIRNNRANWGKSKFWGLLLAFSFVHLTLALKLIPRVAAVPLVLYGVLTGTEYLALSVYLAFFLGRRAGTPNEKL